MREGGSFRGLHQEHWKIFREPDSAAYLYCGTNLEVSPSTSENFGSCTGGERHERQLILLHSETGMTKQAMQISNSAIAVNFLTSAKGCCHSCAISLCDTWIKEDREYVRFSKHGTATGVRCSPVCSQSVQEHRAALHVVDTLAVLQAWT